jgi:hypothetical protein
MKRWLLRRAIIPGIPLSLLVCAGIPAVPAQEPDSAGVIQQIDTAAKNRYENVLGFTVTEHYVVMRGKDSTTPAAEMTVKTTYKKGEGKSYRVLSQSGSELIFKFVLRPLLDSEKDINVPGNVERSWFTSANYEMHLKPGSEQIDGHDCIAISISPKRKAPNMVDGTLWLDAHDRSMVRMEGISSQSPSTWTNPPHLMRQYTTMNGYAMATHSRAESDSFLFGRTVVTIDYTGYQLQLRAEK